MEKKPIKITDLTLRDGQQSLFATRMRTEDMLPIAEQLDSVGFHSIEMWGGATFDVMTRFLDEDPWERLRLLKDKMPKTKFQMLLRGQNLVGYRNYADDVVDAFVEHACSMGIDIFRIFDALNDERNCLAAFKAVKKCGRHVQGTICYSLTERRLGGPIYTLDYYVDKARQIEDMGADSLCIKDMAGILSPFDSYDLVSRLKESIGIPVHLHTHYTSGMASMSIINAIEAGADGIDTCLAPFSYRSSHAPVEPLIIALKDSPFEPTIDLDEISRIDRYLEEIIPTKLRTFSESTRHSGNDIGVILHQIPGGMITNLVSQLEKAGALDRLDEVYEEIPRTRKDMGYPPLVTPTSQIVGVQSVFNVIMGRYKMISNEVKDYFYGLYGRPPAPVDEEIRSKALKGYHLGTTPIDVRPADTLHAEMHAAKDALKDMTNDIGDILIYALYPMTGMEFLKKKYGKDLKE
ncbi:MAG: pyruvate carboxylase subunit B [Syntrophorhabdaceae bacterium]